MNRIEWIDRMRGLAIMLVVTGHLLQFNGIPTSNAAFEWIYSFHMPLFFAISGYCAAMFTHIVSASDLKKFVLRKLVAIALPLYVWTLFVDNVVLKETIGMLGADTLVWQIVDPGYWFLKHLLIIMLVYGAFEYISHRFKSYFGVATIVLIMGGLIKFKFFDNGLILNMLAFSGGVFFIGTLSSRSYLTMNI